MKLSVRLRNYRFRKQEAAQAKQEIGLVKFNPTFVAFGLAFVAEKLESPQNSAPAPN
jgi:hypothetical protein